MLSLGVQSSLSEMSKLMRSASRRSHLRVGRIETDVVDGATRQPALVIPHRDGALDPLPRDVPREHHLDQHPHHVRVEDARLLREAARAGVARYEQRP